MRQLLYAIPILFLFLACNEQLPKKENSKLDLKKAPFIWEAANIYFLLTDRFNNGKE